MKKILIIGGAGFIGSHTADLLLEKGYEVRILDSLSQKTHGGDWPEYLNSKFEKIKGEVQDKEVLTQALQGMDGVINLAAWMDLTPDFGSFSVINVTGTALLYEIIVKEKLPIKKVIVASSQFVYGEGRWECSKDGVVFPKLRTNQQMSQKNWDPLCPVCGGPISSLLNQETHQDPPNMYAITKYTQELMALKLGKLFDIPSVAMRYSIVHGPRQSIKNSYSGALRIFSMQLLQNQPLSIYEDGESLRDYVSVYDVAAANVKVLEDERANFENFNVGGGKGYTVTQLAQLIGQTLGQKIDSTPTGKFRVGDIRHAVSDISKLKSLGWEPKMSEEVTVQKYIEWLKTQKIDATAVSKSLQDLQKMGVVRE